MNKQDVCRYWRQLQQKKQEQERKKMKKEEEDQRERLKQDTEEVFGYWKE